MRKDFLDGIRGWASVMVLLSHLIQCFAVHTSPALAKRFLLFPSDGTYAVYIFFVVSGFALSTTYFENGDTSVLTSLALRRYPRLTIPIAASCVISFATVKLGLAFAPEVAGIANSQDWLGNFYRFPDSLAELIRFVLFGVYFSYDASHVYNPVLWTMSIELWGSMLVFGLLCVFRGVNRLPLYLAALSILYLLRSPLTSFILGMILADLYRARVVQSFAESKLAAGISVGALAACIAFSTFRRDLYGEPFNLSIAAFLIVGGIMCWHPARSAFECRVSRLLGKLSFPLYLTHLLVIGSFSSYLYLWMTRTGHTPHAAANIMIIASVPVCFAVAALFQPIESFSVKSSRRLSDLFLSSGKGRSRPTATRVAADRP